MDTSYAEPRQKTDIGRDLPSFILNILNPKTWQSVTGKDMKNIIESCCKDGYLHIYTHFDKY